MNLQRVSKALPVVPAKLVRHVLCAEYVDMAELLKDNMEAERRRMLADSGSSQSHFGSRQSRRKIPDILSWLHCFSLYAAVVTSVHPEKNMRAASLPGYHSQRGQEVWGAGMVAV